ncbi:uncharacterized protein BYT42DRAFT_556849 [Radiomyces spectabilis]|uniref:uncharacterized protein n=1 Tax=Radiomyces spectabilis TaxID=64574 RepID=UPI00221F7E3B|nr:uncharacterized protein BYT42DRAFT_556849 [Radiomyces spectabilis]KAI8391434.1 hypothetical protein BYT42DRAFT_556849 [Radiomyces spectabilis]
MVGDCCLIFIIILLPPLGVFLMKGCTADFWINICLTILGYLPGHLHAFYVMIKKREQQTPYVAGGGYTAPPPGQGYGAVPPA